ncbi:MAG: xylulokinase [Actinomycetes bacterium]|jgi:xylulokinase|nr:xylulokinase [Actinomycetes bacterium]
MHLLLGIDVGTSGCKVALFDPLGTLHATATYDYPLVQPQNGWAEQDPRLWWDATVAGITDVLHQMGDARDTAAHIAGIGVTGQMHGLVMLDAAGRVIRDAILWCDGRTVDECAEITRRVGAQQLIDITANPALPGFTAGKILWVRAHEPENYARCRHILMPKDYIRYKLTDVIAAEATDASGTNLFDVACREWSDQVLGALDIDAVLMPAVLESPDVAGEVTRAAAEATGLRVGTPVAAGAGDNAAAAVGLGIVHPGRAFTSIGSSGVIYAHSDKVRIDAAGRVHTFCAAVPHTWTVMSCTLAAGLSLRWYRDTFCADEIAAAAECGIDVYDLLNEEIARIPRGADRLLFLPYLMGERSPLLDSYARGTFFGLSCVHGKYHLLRAVMEGVSYSLRQCLDVLRDMSVVCHDMLACGGGGRSRLWRQMLADIYDLPVIRPRVDEGPAFGAALLGGVGAGVYADVREACALAIRDDGVSCTPDAAAHGAYEPYYRLFVQLYPQLREQFAELAQL